MTPTREQFKDLITSIKKAQEKEDNLDKAFELIWDDEQGQYPPFLSRFYGESSIRPSTSCLVSKTMNTEKVNSFGGWKWPPRMRPFIISVKKNSTSATLMPSMIIWQNNQKNKSKKKGIDMGTYSSIYIEFKKKDQWHLLEGIVPLDYKDWSYYGGEPSPEDNHAIEIGGVKMGRMFTLGRQGCVRDLLAGHDTPFNDRGFPDDLSPELKAMFDKVQQKIDEHPDSFLRGRDWRWGKSWCYLTELQSYLDERLEKCKSAILTEHSKQLSYGISEKLDAILVAVNGEKLKPKKQKDEDDDDYIDQGEMLEYYLGEELNEIIWLKEFAAGIALIHEFLTDEWFSEDSIRLVFYAS